MRNSMLLICVVLLLGGFVLGRISAPPAAYGQGAALNKHGSMYIFTASEDGQTIYSWSRIPCPKIEGLHLKAVGRVPPR